MARTVSSDRRMLSFQESIKIVFAKYIVLSGRASRSEYWWFLLFSFLLGILTGIADVLAGYEPEDTGIFGALQFAALVVPSMTVTVRRLHDVDRSGWWVVVPVALALLGLLMVQRLPEVALVLSLASMVSLFVLFVFMFLPGTVGDNRFGPDPLIRRD